MNESSLKVGSLSKLQVSASCSNSTFVLRFDVLLISLPTSCWGLTYRNVVARTLMSDVRWRYFFSRTGDWPLMSFYTTHLLTDVWWQHLFYIVSGVTGGGAECPPERLLTGKFFDDVSGKKRQGKMGKGVKIEKKRRNIVKGKVKIGTGIRKSYKKRWALFLFSFTFENDGNLFLVYQDGNLLPGKSISLREKIRKNDFAPSEKYACYAPVYSAQGGDHVLFF